MYYIYINHGPREGVVRTPKSSLLASDGTIVAGAGAVHGDMARYHLARAELSEG
jgi:hypothetical protein